MDFLKIRQSDEYVFSYGHCIFVISHYIFKVWSVIFLKTLELYIFFQGSVDGALLSKLGLTSCDLITIGSDKSYVIGLARSVIANKILNISQSSITPLSLCQDAGAPCQHISSQNPPSHEAIQGINYLPTT